MTSPPLRRSDLASRLEHTQLRPQATRADIERLCAEANQFGLRCVVVNPCRVALAGSLVRGCVGVASVCGFPLGAALTELKIAEALRAVDDGASGIDMVINVGWVLDGDIAQAAAEVRQVKKSLPPEVELKVIIEAPLLPDPLTAEISRRVGDAGADIVKTGTGTAAPVTVQQVRLIRNAVGPAVRVKAAGGIRTLQQCRQLIDAGADLLGCSRSAALVESLDE